MSLITTIFLMEKYGPLLTIDNVAELLDAKAGTIRNKLSAGTLGINAVRPNAAPLFPAQDVAAYIDGLRQRAKEETREAA